jgi:hypothetical protein
VITHKQVLAAWLAFADGMAHLGGRGAGANTLRRRNHLRRAFDKIGALLTAQALF